MLRKGKIEQLYKPASSNFKIGYHPKLNPDPDPDPEKAKNHNSDPDPKQQPDYPVFKIRIRLRCTPLIYDQLNSGLKSK